MPPKSKEHTDQTRVCPSCKQRFSAANTAHAPFCTARCQMVDLGQWLQGSYAIPAEPVDPEQVAYFADMGGGPNGDD